ncbi:hypothetical protein OSB04_001251 [Centaurea solstitialis]|uniref:Uncharacterized protein n=1 Tax=Centaurea solstitialis TaxID=347529 RepID=A0AA38U2D3_9ASTR|nr:hypothetical protein OSB04_001251 [Centaurea solstitialis]
MLSNMNTENNVDIALFLPELGVLREYHPGRYLTILIVRTFDDKISPKHNHLLNFGEKTTTASRKRKYSKKVRSSIIVVVILFLIDMVVGTAILVSIEDVDFIHAFYCISITITSAGSHKCFSTKRGRLVMCSILLRSYTLKEHIGIWREKTTATTTLADLKAADLDHDGVIV